jgi:anti-sigma-K factor RskA
MTNDVETNTAQTSPDKDKAGEYALGLLEGAERDAFEAQLQSDPSLALEVARWQEHFAALGMDVEEVAPPVSVLKILKRELWGENQMPWHRRIRVWEYAIGGMAAALVAYAVFSSDAFYEAEVRVLQASISSSEIDLQVAFASNVGTGLLRIEQAGVAPAQGRVFELWAIAEGAAPVSLGVLPQGRVTALRLDETLSALVRVGVTFALSDEPTGGSPTGAPTGPVLGVGALQVLTNL